VVAFEESDSPRLLPPTDEQVVSIFNAYDTSGDGFIDLDELQAALAKAGKPVKRERAEEIMQQVDANGDGQISLEEFQQVFKLDAPEDLKSLAGLLGLFNPLGRLVEDVLGGGGQWRRTEGGSRYVDDAVGSGSLVLPGGSALIHYTVTVVKTDEVIETSRRGAPLSFPVSEPNGEPSWDDSIAGMRIGGQRRVYVESPDGEPGATVRYDLEVVDIEEGSESEREAVIASLGGRRSITRVLFALTFVPYFVPADTLPPFIKFFFRPQAAVLDQEQASNPNVSRDGLYAAKSLDALFPPSDK